MLVVESDASTREFLRLILEQAGCHVTACPDGPTAVAACMKAGRSYDAVLLDLALPGLSGFELMERIRETPGGAFAPVVCVSARTDEASREEAVARGCVTYLSKPLSARSVLSAIERVAANSAREPAI